MTRRLLTIERHALGPRLFVLGARVHECHLGLAILLALGVGAAAGVVGFSPASMLTLLAALFMLGKDWRDLFPARRDTACWQLGLHRRHVPLRDVRLTDSVPALAGVGAAAVAALNFVSALTPNVAWRGHVLLRLDPVQAVPTFHAFALPAAALLLLCSFYLVRRRRRACQLALVLAVALGVLDLLKGLDFEEASASFAAALLLWWGRDAFHVRHEPIRLRSAVARVPLLAAGTLAVALVAVWLAAPPHAGALAVAREAVDLLLWRRPSFAYRGELGRLPLALELLGLAASGAALYLVFRPLAAPRDLPDPGLRRAAAELVRAHGTDTLAFFKLRADKHYLFGPDRRAFLGYRAGHGVMLVSGDPLGPAEALPALVREAIGFAERHGLTLAVLGASHGLRRLWEQAGLRALYLGDEAIVDTERFSLQGRAIRKVRQSVTRLDKAGYRASLERLDALDPATLAALRAISDSWLRGSPERGFSMALDALGGDHQRETRVLLARDGGGAVRGFLQFVPTYGRAAVSLAAMRREHDTPNGLTEFMVVRALELLREQGVREASLNFAAFARWLHSPAGPGERLLGRLVALASPFFQIESLYRFNAKFFPRWEPRYFLYEGVLSLPRAGVAALLAEGQLPTPAPARRAAAARLLDRLRAPVRASAA